MPERKAPWDGRPSTASARPRPDARALREPSPTHGRPKTASGRVGETNGDGDVSGRPQTAVSRSGGASSSRPGSSPSRRALGTPYAPPPKKKAISMQEELARIAADLDIDSLRTSVARGPPGTPVGSGPSPANTDATPQPGSSHLDGTSVKHDPKNTPARRVRETQVEGLSSTSISTPSNAPRVEKFFPNGNWYKGEWQRGAMHGRGVYRWSDGGEYIGMFVKGKMEGLGQRTWADGRVYRGAWKADGVHGKGTMVWPSGETYVGYFVDGLFHGRGQRTWPNGDCYSGEYEEGKEHGEGEFRGVNGFSYVGSWKQGGMHRRGKCHYPSGIAYNGEFKKNARHGKGRQTWPDGTIYEGDFKLDVVEGYGKKTFPDGMTYRGRFIDGFMSGEGTVVYPDGSGITGTWDRNTLLPGRGSRCYPDGATLTGVFDNRGILTGNAVKTWPDGSSFAGRFTRNAIDGAGTMKWANGAQFVGEVRKGFMTGEGVLRWDGRKDGGDAGNDGLDGNGGNDGGNVLVTVAGAGEMGMGIGTYRGTFVDSMFHGLGDLTLPNGDRYVGHFEKNVYAGEGEFTFVPRPVKREERATGSPRRSLSRSIQNPLETPAHLFSEGAVYSGMWKNGKMHGGGVLRFTAGGGYRGEFREGHLHGRGSLTFPSGTQFMGHFVKSRFSGSGRLIFADGTELVGVFENGKLQGQGRRRLPDGGVYLGDFKDDMEHGYGVFVPHTADDPTEENGADIAAEHHASQPGPSKKASCARVAGLWSNGRVTHMLIPQQAEDGGQFFAGLVDAEPMHVFRLLGRPQPELLPHETTSRDARDTLEVLCFPAMAHPGTAGKRVTAAGMVGIWETGDRYFGSAQGGKKQGEGVYLYPHTSPLVGDWNCDTLLNVRHPPLRGGGVGDRVKGMWAKNASVVTQIREAVDAWNAFKEPPPVEPERARRSDTSRSSSSRPRRSSSRSDYSNAQPQRSRSRSQEPTRQGSIVSRQGSYRN